MVERFRPTGTRYNVLCAGPSSPYVRSTDLIDGPLIAINRAIRTSLPVWCWAAIDDPVLLYPWWPEVFARRDMWYFTLDAWLWRLERLGVCLERCFSAEPVYLAFPDQRGEVILLEDRRGRRGSLPTITKVLGWLTARLGAREIRVLGCDMHGEGSIWSADTHPVRPSRQADLDRWEMERFMLARCIRIARGMGTRIYRQRVEIPAALAA